MKSYSSHPFADIFNLHEGPPLEELAKDIKENGQRDPIILYKDGKSGKTLILDGQRRQIACHKAKVKPIFKEFKGSEEKALRLVISKNLHRRHLSESERSMAAAEYLRFSQEISNNDREKQPVPNGTEPREHAAKAMNVSPRSVSRATQVLTEGTTKLKKAVMDDLVSVSDAAAITDLPAKEQNKAIAAVRSGEARTLKQAVKPKDPKNGEAFYDETKLDACLGKLIRELDQRAHIHGNGRLYGACVAAMEKVSEAIQAWRAAE